MMLRVLRDIVILPRYIALILYRSPYANWIAINMK
jgi:hypothetical protein